MAALIRQWLAGMPEPLRAAVSEAFALASLAKTRRALRSFDQLGTEQRGPGLRVELLATFNLEPLLPVLQLALNCLPSKATLELGPLDNIEGYISKPSLVASEGQTARIVIWRLEEVLPEALYPISSGFPEQLKERVNQLLERIERIASLHQRNATGMPLFLSTIALPNYITNPLFAAQHGDGPFAAVAQINRRIYEVATALNGVHVLDLAWWAASEGRSHSDAMLDFLGRQPLSAHGQFSFALFVARALRPLIVPRRKVLALDLDNTLWGGVVGEDGVSGLKLGHEFPGNVHLRIQRELLELRNRGVLLVMLSKNNESDARQAFDSLPDMILKWDDFALREINWNHKHESLRKAAQELNLGLDSFVFLDDSDYEREQMRQLLPEVLVLNESPDALHILRALWDTDAFDSLTLSEEDHRRHQDYSVRSARSVEAHKDDLEEFLRSLEMQVAIEDIGAANLDRIVTMIGKTNQFNVTTRRHSRAQVQAMLDAPGTIPLALRLRDKFGDQGIVAVLLARPSDSSTLVVDSFLVSCRALGRGVEDALWAEMMLRAHRQSIRRLEATYISTPKNGIVADLYDRFGLQRIGHDSSSTQYVLEPVAPVKSPSWITSKNGTHGE